MNEVVQLTLSNGLNVDILIKNGKIGYAFEYDGQSYGTAVKPKSRKIADIATACLLLLVNAEQTYKELTKDNGK